MLSVVPGPNRIFFFTIYQGVTGAIRNRPFSLRLNLGIPCHTTPTVGFATMLSPQQKPFRNSGTHICLPFSAATPRSCHDAISLVFRWSSALMPSKGFAGISIHLIVAVASLPHVPYVERCGVVDHVFEPATDTMDPSSYPSFACGSLGALLPQREQPAGERSWSLLRSQEPFRGMEDEQL